MGYVYLFKLMFSFYSDKFPEVESVSPMVVLFFNFLRNFMFSTVATSIYIHTNSAQGFPFL